MRKKVQCLLLVALFAMCAAFPFNLALASAGELPRQVSSAYDLIAAVNALRAANGLAPYSINSILMQTAQAQADFMASHLCDSDELHEAVDAILSEWPR